MILRQCQLFWLWLWKMGCMEIHQLYSGKESIMSPMILLSYFWMLRPFFWLFLLSFDGTGNWSNIECQMGRCQWNHGIFVTLFVGLVHIHIVLLWVDLWGWGWASVIYFAASRKGLAIVLGIDDNFWGLGGRSFEFWVRFGLYRAIMRGYFTSSSIFPWRVVLQINLMFAPSYKLTRFCCRF